MAYVTGFHLCGVIMRELFDITDQSTRARMRVAVFAVAEVGVLFMRARTHVQEADAGAVAKAKAS